MNLVHLDQIIDCAQYCHNKMISPEAVVVATLMWEYEFSTFPRYLCRSQNASIHKRVPVNDLDIAIIFSTANCCPNAIALLSLSE